MLYFTFADGTTKGIFSGRFVFKVHGLGDGDANALVEHIEDASITEYGRTLAHEKAHHSASRHSRLGTYLVGLRFWARLCFAFGIEQPIKKYYEKRTVYFALSYLFHEQLVDRVTRRYRLQETSLEPTPREAAAVRQLDRRIATFPMRLWHFTLPLSINLSYRLGALATKEFSVVLAIRDESGGSKLREASTRTGYGGIFNAAFQPSARDSRVIRWIKALHRNINIERVSHFFGRGFNEKRILQWTEIKLQAEFDAIQLLYKRSTDPSMSYKQQRLLGVVTHKFSSPDEYFKRYLILILPFTLKYQGLTPITIWPELYELIDAVSEAVVRRSFSALTNRQKEILSLAGGLFFYHGN